jgi:hypothetical protein
MNSELLNQLVLSALQLEDQDVHELQCQTLQIENLLAEFGANPLPATIETASEKNDPISCAVAKSNPTKTINDNLEDPSNNPKETFQEIGNETVKKTRKKTCSSHHEIFRDKIFHNKTSHDKILVGPKIQLLNGKVDDLQSFGQMIYDKAVSTFSEKQTLTFEQSLFSQSFVDAKVANDYHEYFKRIGKENGITKGLILPPLILRSEVDAIFQLPNMMVICHKTGPMVPLLEQNNIQECENMIMKLYNLHSINYMNIENFPVTLNLITF